MSAPNYRPDDTIEFDPDQGADRPLGLMIGIGVLTLLILAGLGYLVFGNLGSGEGDGGLGLGGAGGPSAIGSPSDTPSTYPSPTDGVTPVPVVATTPATPISTVTHSVSPSASTSTIAVDIGVVNAAMRP